MKHTETENNKNKNYRIYDKQSETWIEVTREERSEYDKWRRNIRQREQYHHRCNCPKEMWWICDGLCIDCKYSVSNNELSLDSIAINNGESTMSLYEVIIDPNSCFEDYVCNKIDRAQLRKSIEKIVPEAKEYFAMKDVGKSDTAISKELNIPRKTLMSRLKKAVLTLKVKLLDYI